VTIRRDGRRAHGNARERLLDRRRELGDDKELTTVDAPSAGQVAEYRRVGLGRHRRDRDVAERAQRLRIVLVHERLLLQYDDGTPRSE
jgi:hypothetical protein